MQTFRSGFFSGVSVPNFPLPWPDDVILGLDVPSKRRLIEVAASLLANQHGVSDALVFRALWRREQASSTALGNGVAVPHARVTGLDAPLTLFIRTTTKIDFAASDGKPVSDFFVILVPEKGDHQEHLDLLATIARMFCDLSFCKELRKITTVADTRRKFESARHVYRASRD